MAKKKTKTSKEESKWPPMHREVEATGEPNSPSEATLHHKPKGYGLISVLAALSGMNQTLAEKMVEDDNLPIEAGELARKYGLSQMDTEGVLEVLNKNRGVK